MHYLLGVDIGTYSSKGMLVGEDGAVAASHTVEHSLSLPKPGWAEHDPELIWWHDFLEIVHFLLDTSRVPPQRIAALGISTISPAVVAVGTDGVALRPAILYGIDTRANQEVEDLERLTGASLSSQSGAPKILWLRRNEPEVWRQTRQIVNGSGYLNLKLTGQATIDMYDACAFNPFFNPQSLRWEAALASQLAPLEWMPRPTWTSEVAGCVTSQAAGQTGLRPGTPVITGTADAAAEAVGAGLAQVGDMMIMYGSSTFFILKTDIFTQSTHFWTSPFLEAGTFSVAGGTATAGSLTRWFRDQFGQAEVEVQRAGGEDAYTNLARLAASAPPGSNGLVVLPYFYGERTPIHDPLARGMIFGLTLNHTRADVYRALLESVGYAIRHNLEAMQAEGIAASAPPGCGRRDAQPALDGDGVRYRRDRPGGPIPANRRLLWRRLSGRNWGRVVFKYRGYFALAGHDAHPVPGCRPSCALRAVLSTLPRFICTKCRSDASN